MSNVYQQNIGRGITIENSEELKIIGRGVFLGFIELKTRDWTISCSAWMEFLNRQKTLNEARIVIPCSSDEKVLYLLKYLHDYVYPATYLTIRNGIYYLNLSSSFDNCFKAIEVMLNRGILEPRGFTNVQQLRVKLVMEKA